ncbi:cyclic pyranopterin monophosphate synthase MoaC [bacterium]|nr:cyclic pyranopterin monophosphate synthase MoaC [bacterium]MCI0613700.1 cyclic pyranopterin monophosphate synthase MoaC [bacterium]
MKNKLTHIDEKGRTRMVDVSGKAVTLRRAVAEGRIRLTKAIVSAIQSQSTAKGNVLETARIGAIQAAKKTSELIPLCHPIPISNISIDFRFQGINLKIRAEVIAEAKTGVEMEALTAAATGLLIVYDMCKGIDKGMIIGPIELLEKEGGKSGTYRKKP